MATVTWDGMDDLQQDLDALPDDLGAAGGALALGAAEQAAVAIKAAYPRGADDAPAATSPEGRTLIRFTTTGPTMGGKHVHLQDGVIVTRHILDFGARAKVVNIAPHAAVFEYGRQLGSHGQTPARPTFIPIRETYQRGLVDALQQLMESRGLVVSGEAGQ